MESTGQTSIAVVDDEADICETVALALEREGHRVATYSNGGQAWESIQHQLPDLVILDILMPQVDGLELCRRLRALSDTLPIIFLSSKDEEFDRVLGLELGADDYLGKPFSIRELVARVRVLLRRLALLHRPPDEHSEELLVVGPLELDQQRYTVRWNELPVQLTVTEFLILRALARRPGHVKTRQQLIVEAYPHDTYVSERTIDSHLKRLRKKFHRVDPAFDAVETVYGLGYRYCE